METVKPLFPSCPYLPSFFYPSVRSAGNPGAVFLVLVIAFGPCRACAVSN